MLPVFGPAEIVVALVLVAFSIAAYSTRALSTRGIVFANLTGLLGFVLGGLVAFVTLVVFYILAEIATWYAIKSGEAHEQRTISNIFGNCAAAIVALAIGQPVAFFGAVSAALADTVSSEIGMLSKSKPYLITTFERVQKGTDGAISALGIVAAIIAGIEIGAVYYFAFGSITMLFVIAIAGVCGSVVDSLFGALFERRGLMNKTHVNLIGSACGALIALALQAFI
ncbi:MAG TPA: DUF92 domain-containing protein [archaeon]|nr:DUF92 domain-containing protein [archaeon]